MADQRKAPADVIYSDQIGWLVPAVPTPDGRSFWGYSSVPQSGSRWWHLLPPGLARSTGWTTTLTKPTVQYIADLHDDADRGSISPYVTRILREAFQSEVVRTGCVDFCRRRGGHYRVRGRTFRTKALARRWCERHRVPSVIDFRA